MKFVVNAGQDRVVDHLRLSLSPGVGLDVATSSLSLFAWEELATALAAAGHVRAVVPQAIDALGLLGKASDRAARNRLQVPHLARTFATWLESRAEVRAASGPIPQGLLVTRNEAGEPQAAMLGALSLSTDGLGLSPGNPMNLIHTAETASEAAMLAAWFDQQWAMLKAGPEAKAALVNALRSIATSQDPSTIYALMLRHLLGGDDALDEERVVNSATGIRNTIVWKKLYRFQRDGVVGVVEKLDRFGGCILADSVGLGKTFEALAVIKYAELRNDRVLVLCPKRLRDNWTLYKTNDRRNILAGDRFNYDVLNHTDLSRDGGASGDIDLANVNWGNYDLVVIDESHNFRNKKSPRAGGETRYDKLMRRVIREGVKTRVLMLSATPVNNRLADLKNQIAFATEGDDEALKPFGVANVAATVRLAQTQFNRWLQLDDGDRRPARLLDMLGFDYFQLLDLLTIARSRKHVEKYYGTAETGKFPERLKPVNIYAAVDLAGEFRPVAEINDDIRRLKLAAYAPLRYVLPGKQAAYDAKYSHAVKGGSGRFRQVDREESLIHLLRVNVLKRMESAVSSFALTVGRQLSAVEAVLARLDSPAADVEERDLDGLDLDDPAVDCLLTGTKVKVLLQDIDRVRWAQDLTEDRDRLSKLVAAAELVDATRDAKLAELKRVIAAKVATPLNPGNRKVLVFTAFSDTAFYLYEHLAAWAAGLGLRAACVTGSGRNRSTVDGLRNDMASILSAFSPLSKQRPADLAGDGDLDLLIATDCISEGQNLQDCDFLVNYDIHWNPVRIIQRFGRIDRLGSRNTCVQLVNFWPNMELEEYIGLEQRVSGRMVLLDLSATGEENVIEQQSGDPMNDLEYRRKQLLKLQDAVIDLEDLSSGVSIADLTLTDFRIDLARLPKADRAGLASMPFGTCAAVPAGGGVLAGAIFCLRAVGATAETPAEPGYPLAPHYLVQIADDGTVVAPFTQARAILDALKRLCHGRTTPDPDACERFEAATHGGERMGHYQKLLAAAVASVVGQTEARGTASLFSPGGTHARPGEFAGIDDFEVVLYLAVVAGDTP